uniref:Uncharacterized protein n=1 Tax=Arundo donax TaxID=35708 RepID=A0A0A9GYD6_ARUDO
MPSRHKKISHQISTNRINTRSLNKLNNAVRSRVHWRFGLLHQASTEGSKAYIRKGSKMIYPGDKNCGQNNRCLGWRFRLSI